MGVADLVPGISGGTIAFIMGFYQNLLNSIKTINVGSLKFLLKFQFKAFFDVVAWRFLLSLLSGILLSFVVLSQFFQAILEHEVYRVYLYSGFLGLVLASFWLCVRQVRDWDMKHMMGLLLSAVAAYAFTSNIVFDQNQGLYAIKMGLPGNIHSFYNYDNENGLLTHLTPSTLGALVTKGLIAGTDDVYNNQGNMIGHVQDIALPYAGYKIDPWLMFCGAIAICALLLPGISGSYLLNLLGVYPVVIGALADFIAGIASFTFDSEAFYILFSLGIGIVAGAVLFARFVSWLLKQYPSFTMALLSGFMIGALRSVWPFWSYEYVLLPLKIHKGPQLLLQNPIWPSVTSPLFFWGAICTFVGFTLVFTVEFLAKRKIETD